MSLSPSVALNLPSTFPNNGPVFAQDFHYRKTSQILQSRSQAVDPADIELHMERMRMAVRHDHSLRVPFNNIESEQHRQVLTRLIKNVLSTEPAHFTYAYIIDDLPIADIAWDCRSPGLYGDHIIDEVHEELCPGAMDMADNFHVGFYS